MGLGFRTVLCTPIIATHCINDVGAIQPYSSPPVKTGAEWYDKCPKACWDHSAMARAAHHKGGRTSHPMSASILAFMGRMQLHSATGDNNRTPLPYTLPMWSEHPVGQNILATGTVDTGPVGAILSPITQGNGANGATPVLI